MHRSDLFSRDNNTRAMTVQEIPRINRDTEDFCLLSIRNQQKLWRTYCLSNEKSFCVEEKEKLASQQKTEQNAHTENELIQQLVESRKIWVNSGHDYFVDGILDPIKIRCSSLRRIRPRQGFLSIVPALQITVDWKADLSQPNEHPHSTSRWQQWSKTNDGSATNFCSGEFSFNYKVTRVGRWMSTRCIGEPFLLISIGYRHLLCLIEIDIAERRW